MDSSPDEGPRSSDPPKRSFKDFGGGNRRQQQQQSGQRGGRGGYRGGRGGGRNQQQSRFNATSQLGVRLGPRPSSSEDGDRQKVTRRRRFNKVTRVSDKTKENFEQAVVQQNQMMFTSSSYDFSMKEQPGYDSRNEEEQVNWDTNVGPIAGKVKRYSKRRNNGNATHGNNRGPCDDPDDEIRFVPTGNDFDYEAEERLERKKREREKRLHENRHDEMDFEPGCILTKEEGRHRKMDLRRLGRFGWGGNYYIEAADWIKNKCLVTARDLLRMRIPEDDGDCKGCFIDILVTDWNKLPPVLDKLIIKVLLGTLYKTLKDNPDGDWDPLTCLKELGLYDGTQRALNKAKADLQEDKQTREFWRPPKGLRGPSPVRDAFGENHIVQSSQPEASSSVLSPPPESASVSIITASDLQAPRTPIVKASDSSAPVLSPFTPDSVDGGVKLTMSMHNISSGAAAVDNSSKARIAASNGSPSPVFRRDRNSHLLQGSRREITSVITISDGEDADDVDGPLRDVVPRTIKKTEYRRKGVDGDLDAFNALLNNINKGIQENSWGVSASQKNIIIQDTSKEIAAKDGNGQSQQQKIDFGFDLDEAYKDAMAGFSDSETTDSVKKGNLKSPEKQQAEKPVPPHLRVLQKPRPEHHVETVTAATKAKGKISPLDPTAIDVEELLAPQLADFRLRHGTGNKTSEQYRVVTPVTGPKHMDQEVKGDVIISPLPAKVERFVENLQGLIQSGDVSNESLSDACDDLRDEIKRYTVNGYEVNEAASVTWSEVQNQSSPGSLRVTTSIPFSSGANDNRSEMSELNIAGSDKSNLDIATQLGDGVKSEASATDISKSIQTLAKPDASDGDEEPLKLGIKCNEYVRDLYIPRIRDGRIKSKSDLMNWMRKSDLFRNLNDEGKEMFEVVVLDLCQFMESSTSPAHSRDFLSWDPTKSLMALVKKREDAALVLKAKRIRMLHEQGILILPTKEEYSAMTSEQRTKCLEAQDKLVEEIFASST